MDSHEASIILELEDLRFTADWPEDVIIDLIPLISRVEFGTSDIIFKQDDENHQLYLLTGGRVSLDLHVPARGSVRLMTLSRGEILAWSALLGDGRMTVSATALEPVTAIAFDGKRLQYLCKVRHEIGFLLMRQMALALSQRLTATRLQLVDAYAHSTPHLLLPPSEGA